MKNANEQFLVDDAVVGVQIFGLVLVLADLFLVARITGRLLDGRKGRDVGALGAVFFGILTVEVVK